MTSKTQLQSKIQELEIETGVPGDTLEDGSILVKKENGLALLVAPASTEVVCQWSKDFPEVFGKLQEEGFNPSQWFVPTLTHLQLACKFIPNHFSAKAGRCYWSSTEIDSASAYLLFYNIGITGINNINGTADDNGKRCTFCVRAFRYVTY